MLSLAEFGRTSPGWFLRITGAVEPIEIQFVHIACYCLRTRMGSLATVRDKLTYCLILDTSGPIDLHAIASVPIAMALDCYARARCQLHRQHAFKFSGGRVARELFKHPLELGEWPSSCTRISYKATVRVCTPFVPWERQTTHK